MAKKIIFGQQKGGVGKTTDTVMTAIVSANIFKKKTLVIDTDLQGNATSFLSKSFKVKSIPKTFMKCIEDEDLSGGIIELDDNLDMIASQYDTRKFGDFLTSNFRSTVERTFYLSGLIKEIENDYEYIFIDIPPSTDIKVDNAMVAADYIVVVQETQQFAFEGSKRLIFEYIQTLVDDFGDMVKLEIAGVLPVLLQSKRPLHQLIVDQTVESFGKENVFNTIINNHARLEYYPRYGIQYNDHHDRRMIALFSNIFDELQERISLYEIGKFSSDYVYENKYFKDGRMTDEGKKLQLKVSDKNVFN